MSAFESEPPDPILHALNDVFDTMNGGGVSGPGQAEFVAAVPYAEARVTHVRDFGPYRREFKDYLDMTTSDQKAAGAAFFEGVETILNEAENSPIVKGLFGGSELRCKCIVNGQEREIVIAQTKDSAQAVFSSGIKGRGERFSYALGNEGEVRRVDRQARTAPEEALNRRASEETQVSSQSSREAEAAAVVALLRQAREFGEQMRLEARMGTNNMPVGIGEIEDMLADVRHMVTNRIREQR